jgi:hypothetical protein
MKETVILGGRETVIGWDDVEAKRAAIAESKKRFEARHVTLTLAQVMDGQVDSGYEDLEAAEEFATFISQHLDTNN